MISGLHRGVSKIFTLLWCYAESTSSCRRFEKPIGPTLKLAPWRWDGQVFPKPLYQSTLRRAKISSYLKYGLERRANRLLARRRRFGKSQQFYSSREPNPSQFSETSRLNRLATLRPNQQQFPGSQSVSGFDHRISLFKWRILSGATWFHQRFFWTRERHVGYTLGVPIVFRNNSTDGTL